MKKALSFAVALGLVAGMASVASAENMLSIHGDARWRGVYSQNTNDATDHFTGVAGDTLSEQGQDTRQEMDQRYRLNADLQINDDVMVNSRLVVADQIFGNNGGNDVVDNNGAAFTDANTVYVDRANMTIKTLGGSWTLGRQDASWGNKFLAYGASVDRVKATYKAADLTFGGYLQKNVEGGYVNGDGDNDTWGAFLVGKTGDASWGLLLNYMYSDANASTSPAGTLGKGDSGYLVDPFVTAKIGPATVLGEFVYKGGDLIKHTNYDKSIYGGFVAAAVDLAPVTVKGLVAYYKNNNGLAVGGAGRDCDNDFAPSLLIGTCNETAVIDFGGTTNPDGTLAHADDSTYLVGAGVDFKANDKLTLGGLVGYLKASDYFGANNNETGSLIEVDLTADYALAQNATYSFGIAYGDVDKFSAKDDAMWVVGNRVEVKW